MFKTLCVLVILAVLLGIYVLSKPRSLTDSDLRDRDEKGQIEHPAKLDSLYSWVSGTVLNVAGKLVTVQETSPHAISLVYINGDLPIGLAPGKTIMMCGEFKRGLFVTDNITITEGTPSATPDTSPQPLGLFDHVIFFIAYWLL